MGADADTHMLMDEVREGLFRSNRNPSTPVTGGSRTSDPGLDATVTFR
jgi:hypothetical protein